MSGNFETMLTGGHPNSLGRTEEVTDLVLADRGRLEELYQTYFSQDEVVRLRVSSVMKRVTIAQPEWTMDYMDGLLSDIAAIDQASTRWTLALLFNETRHLMSKEQKDRATDIMKNNLADHNDWIVLINSMQVLSEWGEQDDDLRLWLRPQLVRLQDDTRKSVAGRAKKLLAKSDAQAGFST